MTQKNIDSIRILEVRVRNFRCLRSVDVKLEKITVLIGQNNSGKTSFLEAIYYAIGEGKRQFYEEDIYLSKGEKKPPKDRSIIIDILIKPWDSERNTPLYAFPADSFWLELWGNGIMQDEDDNDIVGLRVEYSWGKDKGEYEIKRNFLRKWVIDSSKIEDTPINEIAGSLTFNKIEPLSLYFLNEKRDIIDDYRNRKSFLYKLVSDPRLSEGVISDIEKNIDEINVKILDNSEIFKFLTKQLNDLLPVITEGKGDAKIHPIPRYLHELNKAIDISFITERSQDISLSLYGTGTRSIATIFVFRAYIAWKLKEAKNQMHPMLAIEEPENHLHPQAQQLLYNIIDALPGQIIISSHSPFIIEMTPINNIRHFNRKNAETFTSMIDTSQLVDDDFRKIHQMVLKTRGYMLYARALILFEGQTEEIALPIFARKYWNQQPQNIGIELVPVGGDKSYLPFLKLSKGYNIDWYIFSDGEPQIVNDIDSVLGKIGEGSSKTNKRVFIIPNGLKFESYLINQSTIKAIINHVILDSAKTPQHRQALDQEWKAKNDPIQDMITLISNEKTKYAKQLAESLISIPDPNLQFPQKIKELFEAIKAKII